MIRLEKSQYDLAKQLFADLANSQLFCAGVLAGTYDGAVYVDDLENPQAGFVRKDGMWWFLAGNPPAENFIQALNIALWDKSLTGEDSWGGMLVCHPDGWESAIHTLYAPHKPIKTERLHYIASTMAWDWQSQIPEGITIRFANQTLLDDGISLPDTVANVVTLRQESEQPDTRAMGYVAVDKNKVVAYAVIDCIVGTGGDLGFFTDPNYRRRGLGSIVSAAVIAYALKYGLDTIHWDCESFNHGSIKTAEKLGLTLDHRHGMYNLMFNPKIHAINLGWKEIDIGEYVAARDFATSEIATYGKDGVHYHMHYILARALFGVGQPNAALSALQDAAEYGWDNAEEAESDFVDLMKMPLWEGIIAKIHENAKQ